MTKEKEGRESVAHGKMGVGAIETIEVIAEIGVTETNEVVSREKCVVRNATPPEDARMRASAEH